MKLCLLIILTLILAACGPVSAVTPTPASTTPAAFSATTAPSAAPQSTAPPASNPPPWPTAIPASPAPIVWLIVGDTAVLASIGGFEYTIDLGGGTINSTTRDANLPNASSKVALATLPAMGRGVVVIATDGIKEFRATVQPWPPDPNGNSPNERELAITGHREGDAMVYTLAPTNANSDQFLSVFVSFTGGIHNGNYADYYWRINPSAGAPPQPTTHPPAGGLLPVPRYFLDN